MLYEKVQLYCSIPISLSQSSWALGLIANQGQGSKQSADALRFATKRITLFDWGKSYKEIENDIYKCHIKYLLLLHVVLY